MDPSPSHPLRRSQAAFARVIPLLSFLLYLILYTSFSTSAQAATSSTLQRRSIVKDAHESTRQQNDLDQVSYAAPSTTQSSLSGLSCPTIDGYTLGDVVLVSGVDGSLTALNRADGKVRWSLQSSTLPSTDGTSPPLASSPQTAFSPLISTRYGKQRVTLANILTSSQDGLGNDGEDEPSNDFPSGTIDGLPPRTRHLLDTVGMYIVEPGSSGTLYLLTSPKATEDESPDQHDHSSGHSSKAHMQKLPLTLPQLVSLSPFSFPGDKGRVFTGSKHSKLLRIDPLSGEVDRTWDADGAEIENFYHHAQDEDTHKWAYLARTDFTLSVSLPRRPHLTQTLHYSTYAPQSSDADLASRWLQMYTDSRTRLDAPVGDGKVILPTGLDRDGRGASKLTTWNASANGRAQQAWSSDVTSQIVDVFDLLLPSVTQNLKGEPRPHPIIVPHPPFALHDARSGHAFDGLSDINRRPDADDEETASEEETLLTFSPETGSLYALSSKRFPGVVKQVNNAWAGLDEEQRGSRSLVTGSTFHHPMQCRTFGCWLGRYRVQNNAREADSRGLLEAGMDRLGIGAGVPRPPLEISDHAANPEQQASPRTPHLPPSSEPTSVTAHSRGPFFTKKMLFTQATAIFFIAAFVWLVRKGLQEQQRVQRARNEAVLRQTDLQWSNQPVAQPEQFAKSLPPDNYAESSRAESKALESTNGRTQASAEAARQELLAEHDAQTSAEQATANDGDGVDVPAQPDGAKKKRRRRGKRAGAAVKLRNKAHAVANGGAQGDDSGASDDDDDASGQKGNQKAGAVASEGPAPPVSKHLPPPSPVVLDPYETANPASGPGAWNGGWIQTGPGSKSAESQLVELAAVGSTQGYERIHPTSPLETSDEVLGFGSSGTVVVKGRFQNRVVAVKRLVVELVHLASQEISLLESADDHPNVIRYFYKEQRDKFLYIALELCPASLGDIVENPEQWKDLAVRLEPKKAVSQIASGIGHLHSLGIVHRDIKPPNILVAYANPHSPSSSSLKMLLSDFGLSKRIDSMGGQNSFSQTMHHPGGTAGWRAPEILRGDVNLNESGATTASSLHGLDSGRLMNGSTSSPSSQSMAQTAAKPRLTRAVDVFSFGCLAYYLLTSGDHPFGARYEREVNIIRGNSDTSRLAAFGEEGLEADHLIQSMIQADPTQRPRAAQILSHPYFWDAGKRLGFLQDVSDRLEVVDRERDKQIAFVKAEISSAGEGVTTSFNGASAPASPAPWTNASLTAAAAAQVPETEIMRRLETRAREVTEGGDWTKKVDKAFMDDLGKWRKYQGGSVRDLLRALRNKKHHYQDMPPALRRSMGTLPDGFLKYFTKRFPKLFLHVYEVIAEEGFIRSETTFEVSTRDAGRDQQQTADVCLMTLCRTILLNQGMNEAGDSFERADTIHPSWPQSLTTRLAQIQIQTPSMAPSRRTCLRGIVQILSHWYSPRSSCGRMPRV